MKRSALVLFVVVTAMLYLPASGNSNAATVTLIPYCTNLQTSSTVIQGTSSNVTFNCGSTPAFRATQTTTTFPSFRLPTGYTAIYVNGTTTIRLRSGVSMHIPPGNYTYVVRYGGSKISALSTFSVSWHSPRT